MKTPQTIRKRFTVVTALVVGIILHGQTPNLNQGTVREGDYFTEIPFEYVSNKIIIPVTIQDKTYRFLLDTGAPNCISAAIKNKLSSGTAVKIPITDANSTTKAMELVAIPKLALGGLTFENTVALTYADMNPIIFGCFEIDGFIGSNLLRNSVIQIDAKNKILRITNKLENLTYNKKSESKITLTKVQSSPYIWVQLNDKKAAKEPVLIDTGMKGFYDLSSRTFTILKKKTILPLLNTGKGKSYLSLFDNTVEKEQSRVLIPSLTVANTRFTNINTETTSETNSRVGMEFLELGIATIDYLGKHFYFDAYNETNDLTEHLQPFTPTLNNNKLAIGIVWDSKLKNQLSSGDQIITVNNIAYDQYDPCDLITKPSVLKGIIIKELTVKKADGRLLTLSL